MDDKLSFLGGDTPAETPAPAETAAVVAEPIAEGPARGPDGKFVSAAPPAAPEPEPAPAASPEPVAAAPIIQPEPGHVPITALMDERDRRQAAERKAAELEAWKQQQERQQANPPPDQWEDPEGYAAHQQAQIDAKLRAHTAMVSRRFAERQYGAELVNTVQQWAETKAQDDPFFRQQTATMDDPYEFAVQAYQRDQIATQFKPADLDDFRAWQAAKAAGLPPPAATAAPATVAAPPRSLVSATSAGGAIAIPIGDGQAFDSLFSQRK